MILCNFTILLKEINKFEFIIKIVNSDLFINKYLTIKDDYLNISLICKNERTLKYLEFKENTGFIIKHLPKNCIYTYKEINFSSDVENLKLFFNELLVDNDNQYFYIS